LTFSTTGLPAGATLTPDVFYGRANFEWTPTAGAVGTYNITFTVKDNGNGGAGPIGQDSRTMRVIVRTANAAPVLVPIGNKQLFEGQLFELHLVAADADGDMLTYSAATLPPGALFDAQTGVLRWTPHLFQAGDYSVTFNVTDGNKSASETVKLSVQNVNQAPILAYMPTQSTREGVTLSFNLIAGDPDADPIRYSTLTPLPAGAFFDKDNGTFEWTPTFEQAGVYPITFAATDINGATDTFDLTVRVSNVNRAPTLTVKQHAVLLGNDLTFNVVGSDRDQNTTLTYSALGLPEGATLNPATGQIHWVPGPGQAGDYLVRVSVSDGAASTMEPLLLRALTTPQAPTVVIETTPSFPALPGQDVVLNFAAETHVDRSIAGAAEFVVTNTLGVQVLLDACLRAGVPRVVQVSTDEVYGTIPVGSWTETHLLEPNSPYAAAKAGGKPKGRLRASFLFCFIRSALRKT
jgi:hypothetical protein